MVARGMRTLVTVTLALAVVLGGVAGPAAAAGDAPDDDRADERDEDRGERDDRARDDDGNSSLELSVDADVGPGGGSGSIDCTGDPLRHSCDKEGELRGGPAAVDYEGDNYGDFPGRTGGGGDEFVVTVAGQEFVVWFDCDLGPEPPEQNPCAGDVLTPAGDLPA